LGYARRVRPDEHVLIELNPRERRLYDRLRTRVVDAPEPGQGSGLRDLLLLLPDLTVLLGRLLRDPRVPRRSKWIALLGVGYVLSPIDLLPALLLGPLGLLDDLIVVTAALSHLLNHIHPDVVRSAWPGQGDALDAIQRAAAWSERFVGGRLRGLVRGALRLEQR
jgi:uncharacterized membrane protein YkvA (DUF1232 family)